MDSASRCWPLRRLARSALLLLLGAWIRRRATEIVVTDRRVIFKRGLISRHTVEMNVSKIETVDVEQGLAGRIWDYGTVLIRGTGLGLRAARRRRRAAEHPQCDRRRVATGG